MQNYKQKRHFWRKTMPNKQIITDHRGFYNSDETKTQTRISWSDLSFSLSVSVAKFLLSSWIQHFIMIITTFVAICSKSLWFLINNILIMLIYHSRYIDKPSYWQKMGIDLSDIVMLPQESAREDVRGPLKVLFLVQ